MFKISLLHATSGRQKSTGIPTDSKRSPKQTHQQQADRQPTSLASALEPRDWSIQAATVTDGLLDASKYKSLAVYAEVKLAEALEKAANALPDSLDEDGELVPNSLKTAVCCQLLGELAELCGPFSGTLLKLRDELLPALYSSFAGAQTGRTLQFDQMPWFMVANQLQCQNQALLDQQAAFKLDLDKHQAQMLAVEQQLLAFKTAMDAGEAAAAELQLANANLAAARDAAVEEEAAAVDESKRLAAEVLRLKDELGEVQEALNNAKEVASQDMEQWQGQLEAFKKQLHVEKQEREAAVALAAARLTPQEGQELEQRCQEAERRLEEAEQKLAATESVDGSNAEQLQLLTPRPTEWGTAQQLADTCKATSETVRQLLRQQAAIVAALQRQVQLQQALAQPEPSPKPLQLSLKTESLAYFITEGRLDADGGTCLQGSDGSSACNKPKLFAEALGLGREVPRFLRWDQAVELQDVSLQQLQQQISSIWECKAEYEALHGPCHLQTYLHHHCVAAAAAAVVGAGVAKTVPNTHELIAAAAAAASNSSSGLSAARSTTTAEAAEDEALQLTAAVGAAVAAGYQLYYALNAHRSGSAAAGTMWHVLTGQLPEAVLQEQLQHVHGLQQMLLGLAAGAPGSSDMAISSPMENGIEAGSFGEPQQTAGLSVSDLSTVLRLLYPVKQPQQLSELATMLETACRSISSSDSSSSIASSSASISVQGIAAVAAAVGQQANTVVGCGGFFQHHQEQQLLSKQKASQNSSISSTATAEAVQLLLECLVTQYLQDSVTHTQQVVQQVQQLLTGTTSDLILASGATISSSTATDQAAEVAKQSKLVPPANSPVWHHVSALLRQHMGCSSRDTASAFSSSNPLLTSRQPSISGRQGTADGFRRLGSDRSGRYSTAVGASAVHEMSVVAAAAAGRTNSIRADIEKVIDASAENKCMHSSGCCTAVDEWLAAAKQVAAGKLEVQQLLQWLTRQCLLVPEYA